MIAALINHLWQSTLFAAPAGLLTLALRRNHAGVRYGLWFAASVKFLIPFALLAAAGRLIVDRLHLSLAPPRGIETIASVVQPFAPQPVPSLASPLPAAPQATLSTVPHAAVPAPHAPLHLAAVPFDILPILLGVWALGLGLVLLVWALRWSRIRAALRVATPSKLPAPVPVLSTPVPMEPGVVGIVRPVLIVPDGIADRLSPAEWKAVLDHELCHIRRRDNLTGAIHMLVEALFWFHPLVWWLGARLVAEREQACDEAVVRGGADARTYAEGILKVCRLYLRQPLACAAGVSGSDLKARVEAILNSMPKLPLSPFKKALLLAAGAGAIATPVMAGLIVSPEARQAVARAAAVTSTALGVTLRAPDSDAAKPTILARAQAVLSPAISVAALDVPATPLARDITPPTVEAPPPAAAPAPVPLAAATPPAPRASAVRPTTDPAEIKRQAAEFVQAYEASAQHALARWGDPICAKITGLEAGKAAAVKARVEAVARTVGASVQRDGCQNANVQIDFTTDKAASRPIEAWYVTNGVQYGSAGTNPLKVSVVYQNYQDPTVSVAPPSPTTGSICCEWNSGVPEGDSNFPTRIFPQRRPSPQSSLSPPEPTHRQLASATVSVDTRLTGKASLGLLSDYVAMLALSQPSDLGACKALPSVTDLYANCPDRGPPTGLTAADVAFLTALYAVKPDKARNEQADISDSMARILGKDGARAEAAPTRPIKPAAYVAPPKDPAEIKRQAADFVKSYADATPFHVIGRWAGGGLCIHVTGLSAEQDEAVRVRVKEVANSLGQIVWSTDCQRSNVQIDFTEDAQGVLDSVKTHKPNPLGDRTSDTVDVKTVTLPIQAWYVTNGVNFVENDRNDANSLKVNVVYQIAGFPNLDNPGVRTPEGGAAPRAFTNVLVIVDRRKTGQANLTALTDYAAMLALSEPRALGRCNVLPSITDLFASCPGRPAPDGLTPADTAYLTALYTAKGVTIGSSHEAHVIDRMANVLADPRAVDPNLAKAREAASEASTRCGPFVFRLGTDHSHLRPRCDVSQR